MTISKQASKRPSDVESDLHKVNHLYQVSRFLLSVSMVIGLTSVALLLIVIII